MTKILKVLALASTVMALTVAPALAASPHFIPNRTPTCSLNQAGDTVTCTGGKIAGVGTEPTQVGIDVAAGCATKGNGNEPKGHEQEVSAPINPKGGNITFGQLSVSADCPPGLNPVFGSTVQFFIVQDGVRTNVGDPIQIT
jgi:hypothetical protein